MVQLSSPSLFLTEPSCTYGVRIQVRSELPACGSAQQPVPPLFLTEPSCTCGVRDTGAVRAPRLWFSSAACTSLFLTAPSGTHIRRIDIGAVRTGSVIYRIEPKTQSDMRYIYWQFGSVEGGSGGVEPGFRIGPAGGRRDLRRSQGPLYHISYYYIVGAWLGACGLAGGVLLPVLARITIPDPWLT